MWDQIRTWLANPILIKHVRTRLRPQTAFTSLAFVVLLCLCIAYAGYQLNLFRTGTAAGLILALQFILLIIMGSNQVGASVSGARTSGILDFHRVSPMTPAELTFGFFFGAPIREYVLFAATLPFTALCMAFGIPSFRGFVQLMLLLLMTVWTLHAVVLLNSLIVRGKTASGGIVVLALFIYLFGGSLLGGRVFSASWVENDHRLEFFGFSLPAVPVVLIYQAPLLFFILLASTRKMESPRLHALNRPQAILAMVAFATLVLGLVWRKADFDTYEITALYLLAVPALLLTLIVAASQSEYAKGLYRAQKLGKTRQPWWDDLSVSWVTVAILAGIVLAVGTAAHVLAVGEPSRYPSWAPWGNAGSFPLALALTVLTVAYFGFAYQYFQLRFAKRGNMYFTLFLFVTWFLPNVAGWIQAIATAGPGDRWAGAPLFALSPAGGIGMVARVGDESLATAVQAAAITPALLYTFVFNYLLIGARRRVMQRVFASTVKKTESEPLFELAEPVAEGV